MKKIEEVKILAGPYKGYTGFITGVNAFKRVYSVLIEANGKYANIPINSVQVISTQFLEDLEIQEVPKGYMNIDNEILYNTIEDSPFEKDILDEGVKENDIEDYIESIAEESSKAATKRKRSSDGKGEQQEYIRGYNEAYQIQNERQNENYLNTNYNPQDRQYVKIIKENLEQICQSLGYEITGHPLNFYYTHSDEILNLINDTKHKIYSKEQYNSLKDKSHIEFVKKDDTSIPREYISKGLKNYIKVDENILKVVSSTYMYYFINNNGIKSYNNLRAIQFLKNNNLQLTSKNYYIATLQETFYFNNSNLDVKMIQEIGTVISNMQQLIEKSTEYYILSDTVIQSIQMPFVIKKETKEGEKVKREYVNKKYNYKPLKFQVISENNLTKRVKIQNTNDPTVLQITDIIYKDNIDKLHSNILNVYLEYNALFNKTYKIDFYDYLVQSKKGDGGVLKEYINSKDLVNNLSFLYKMLNGSELKNNFKLDEKNKESFLRIYYDIRVTINEPRTDITTSLQESVSNIFSNYSNYCRKEINSALSDTRLYESLSKMKVNVKQEPFKEYTHQKLKRLITENYSQIVEKNNLKNKDKKSYSEIMFAINNFDNIISNRINPKDLDKYADIIKQTKLVYKNNTSILLYGKDSTGKSDDTIKMAQKYHKNDFFKIESRELKELKQRGIEENIKIKKEIVPRKNALAINEQLHKLIESDANKERDIDPKKFKEELSELKLLPKYPDTVTTQRFKNIEKRILDNSKKTEKVMRVLEYTEDINPDDSTKKLIELINKSFKK